MTTTAPVAVLNTKGLYEKLGRVETALHTKPRHFAAGPAHAKTADTLAPGTCFTGTTPQGITTELIVYTKAGTEGQPHIYAQELHGTYWGPASEVTVDTEHGTGTIISQKGA